MLCEVQMVYTFIIIIYDIIIYYTTVYALWGTNGVHIHTLKNAVASFSFNTVSSAYSNCGYKWRSEEQGLSD